MYKLYVIIYLGSDFMVALVTGSAKGIGKEIVLGLASKSIDIIITYNTSEEAAYKLKEFVINNYGVKVSVVKCDISNEEDIISLKNSIEKEYGHLDILVNNAALSLDNYIDDKTKEDFMKVLEVNVVGTFLVIKYLYKLMNNGIIVNVSSTDAEDTYSDINIDYSASKAGINIITKALRLDNVKVIGVMPNWTDTESIREMNPKFLEEELKRIKQDKLEDPKEVANNIIDLIFDENITSGEIRRV